VLEAIRRREGPAAAAAMREHISHFQTRIREIL
jgi:DNA-binding GntR family transcriptional regulator